MYWHQITPKVDMELIIDKNERNLFFFILSSFHGGMNGQAD